MYVRRRKGSVEVTGSCFYKKNYLIPKSARNVHKIIKEFPGKPVVKERC